MNEGVSITFTLALRDQNAQHVRGCTGREIPQLFHGPAAQWMRDDNIRIVRRPAKRRHGVCARDERLGAYHRSRDSPAFQCESVVHTAR